MQQSTASTSVTGRRSFLTQIAWIGLGSVTAATITVSSIAALGNAFGRRGQAQDWNPLVTLSEIPENTPSRFNLSITETTGWLTNNSQEAVWVLKQGDNLTVFSAICPHAGCPIGLETGGFFCGCHGSRWTTNGDRIAGPAPRGLDKLPIRLRDNVLEVRYQKFKTGTATQEPLG
jgi:Rieske Fe-S protein